MYTFTKFIFIFALVGLTACQKKEDITIKTPSGDQVVFSVSIAETLKEQQKGLMFVENMPDEEGMVFVYHQPSVTKFWMKNTLIPLDILFFDSSHRLVHVERNAVPHDETPRGPDTPICSVLEINSGLAEKLNIVRGSKLMNNFSEECLQSSYN